MGIVIYSCNIMVYGWYIAWSSYSIAISLSTFTCYSQIKKLKRLNLVTVLYSSSDEITLKFLESSLQVAIASFQCWLKVPQTWKWICGLCPHLGIKLRPHIYTYLSSTDSSSLTPRGVCMEEDVCGVVVSSLPSFPPDITSFKPELESSLTVLPLRANLDWNAN